MSLLLMSVNIAWNSDLWNGKIQIPCKVGGNGQFSMINDQWSIINEQWSIINGQLSMGNGQ
jgi:hypothetical protein